MNNAAFSQNRLLATLSEAEFERLSPHLELVCLAHGDVLYQCGGQLTHIYFPTTSIVSIQYELEDGGASEIASVGNEGLLGVSLFMGGATTPNRAVVHSAGYGYRLWASHLLEEFHRKGPLFDRLLRYTQGLMTQMSQTAVCNSHHSTTQRLCRWLLQTLDHSNTSELVVTQEALGTILGVRREGITEAARRLQALGLISCRRGRIRVLTRVGLEQQVCECYEVMRKESARLMAPQSAPAIPLRVWLPRSEAVSRRTGPGERRNPPAHDADDAASNDAQAIIIFTR
ncbi:Crp/Fnr family transcriptional regulator [Duganella sp. S19_KUP01_CR8]|uniref:Crp/Fnr family transcriptional regulator n=1 Tax=Duganella sp. S19_KUP01_CR8 TaxID=3025502 RepID=UPI002FCD9098